MTPPERRVLIVGAGIGGLAAALALRRARNEVVVVERMHALSRYGGAFTLASNAMLALRSLEVDKPLEARGATLERFEHRTQSGKLLTHWPLGEIGREVGAPSVAARRIAILEVLMDALDSVDVRFGHEFTGLSQDESGVTVRFANGAEERVDLVVGADGADSAVRQTYDRTRRRYAGYTTMAGIAAFEDFSPATQVQTYGRGTVLGTKPIGGGDMYWYVSRTTEAGGKSDDLKRDVLALVKGWHEPLERLIEATDPNQIGQSDIFDLPRREAWGVGRVTLLGDAAHPMAPALGQGACQAIEDAVVLARHLDAQDDDVAALRAYEVERIARTAPLAERARKQGKLLQGATSVTALARNLTFRLVPKRKIVQGMTETLRWH